MFIATCFCDWKCCKENNCEISMCQNSNIAKQSIIEISADEIFRRYQNNTLTSAIIFGGLEPLLQQNDVLKIISYFRKHDCNDMFIIYTGYYENEVEDFITQVKQFKNIIIKFGRYKPNKNTRYDEVLGVTLASPNQYARQIS